MPDISYKEFMESVIKLIDGFDINDYRNYILTIAENTSFKDRMEFIRSLQSVDECEEEIQELISEEDDGLINEIKELAHRVDNSEYSYGYGWDSDYGREREMGDESWATEVDYFLERATARVRGKDYKVARRAYEMAFNILLSEDLPCYEQPKDMLNIDLGEQVGLYFRAIYMTAKAENRAEEIYESIISYFHLDFYKIVRLKDMLGAETSELPQLDTFLSEWIELLMNKEERFGSELLREAVILKDGIEGIKIFAGKHYKRFPAAYRDWVNELEKIMAKPEEIMAAAREGLNKIHGDYIIREDLAKALINQGNKINSHDVIQEGMKEAVHSRPSIKGILEFVKLEKEMDNKPGKIITNAIERQQQLKKSSNELSWNTPEEMVKARYSGRLLNMLFLLSSNIKDAYELCMAKGSGDNLEELTLAFILRALSHDNIKVYVNMDNLWNKNLETIKNELYSTELSKFLEAELKEAIAKINLSNDEKTTCSNEIIKLVTSRADDIVSNQRRGQYDSAALLLGCCKEMLWNIGEKEKGLELINRFKNKYPRHRNFISTLKDVE